MKKKKIVLEKPKLTTTQKNKIKKHRKQIKDIIEGKDDKFLLIIGPCSAWPEKATLEYAQRLSALQQNIADKIKIVMRVYTQKPRTNLGWKGLALQKDPCKEPNTKTSIKSVQNLMNQITELDLAIADEALFLNLTYYYEDFLSYIAIGARSSEDQEHRSYAATLDFAVGVKNPSSGDMEIASNSVLAAQNESLFYLEGEQRISDGNPYAHLVLRGGRRPNYFEKDIKNARSLLKDKNIKNLSTIIDCNHANSQKNYLKQIQIAKYVVNKLDKDKQIKQFVKGLMIESFIKDGNQSIDCKKGIDMHGLSITDPSLGWKKTEELINWIYNKII